MEMISNLASSNHEMVTTVLKVFLAGSDDALHQAYRRSVAMVARHHIDFGDEAVPGFLEFRWEWIEDYRVLTVLTDGAGITCDFSDIPGIEECLWVMYDDGAGIYCSNDADAKVLNKKEVYGIPDADYEIDKDSVSETSGIIGFDPEIPDCLS